MLDEYTLRQKREEQERLAAKKIQEANEANRKKNSELRSKEQAKKDARAERERVLRVPSTMVELESEARTRATYMKKVSKIYVASTELRQLAQQGHNRIQRILTWRKKFEDGDLAMELAIRRGAGAAELDALRKKKNEDLKEALLHWYAAGEIYRAFKTEENRLRGGQSGDEGTD